MEYNDKKVHFYLPKKKIDVENQTFFDNHDQFLYNNNNFYERQYQSSINSLFDLEPPEKEVEKMIKYDYSSRIAFYLTRLNDERFEPLTPTNNLFSNSNSNIRLEILNEGFIICNSSKENNSSDYTTPNNNAKNTRRALSLSFDNDASVIYSIIQSFITGRINSPMLIILDKLQVPYSSYGNIICEIFDYRFNPEITYLKNCDEYGVYQKKIVLKICTSSIYYLFTLAKHAQNRRKAVHLNTSNIDNLKPIPANKTSNNSLTPHASISNITSDAATAAPLNATASADSFHPIKKNEISPNLISNTNIIANQINANQPRDDKINPNFNQIPTEPPPMNAYPNESNPMIINMQNKNFLSEPYQTQMNEYVQNLNMDQPFLPNQNMKDSPFQIPIQLMNLKQIPTDSQPMFTPQLPQQPTHKQQQQLQKQLQQFQKAHVQKHKQQLQQQLQMMQQQQLQQFQQLQQHFQQQQFQQQQQLQQQQQQQQQIQSQIQQPQQQQIQTQQQQTQIQQQQQKMLQKFQQMQKIQLQKQQKQPNIQTLPNQSQTPPPKVEPPPRSASAKQEESPPKSKSKSHSQAPPAPQNHPASMTAISEAEARLTVLLHPTFCTDPSPDVCRAASILDFRKKMWNESSDIFIRNFNQIRMHHMYGLSSNSQNINNDLQQNQQTFQTRPPRDKIVVPETITQLLVSKNMTIKFSSY